VHGLANRLSAQKHDSKNALVGRIARAAAVFCADEIIVYNDGQFTPPTKQQYSHNFGNHDGYTGDTDPDNFLFHVLSYLECPPILRQKLFPLHENLRTAGTLPSLDMPHHSRRDYWTQYREGVTLDQATARAMNGQPADPQRKKQKKENRKSADANGVAGEVGTAVDVGFPTTVTIPVDVPPNTRVTVKFENQRAPPNFPFRRRGPGEAADESELLTAEAVDPAEPREEGGYYWGYTVRQASSLSAVFTECAYEDGYDVSIGTSERGVSLSSIIPPATMSGNVTSLGSKRLNKTFQHALVVFGGVAGLEAAAEADPELVGKGIGKENVSELFDFWVNACPGQGSRTIRTEEAVWVALSQLHEWVQGAWNE
jgi:predicted SPOUT superfamily RNA methylase MTH1